VIDISYLSVSTWSLHRLLGPLRWKYWDADSQEHKVRVEEQPQQLTLLELPAEAARRGYQAVEICHFQFPATDQEYLDDLNKAFIAAGVSFDTLLLDYGDLTSKDPVKLEADDQLIRHWIVIAAGAGAKQIRIIAGEAAPDDEAAIRQAAEHLANLEDFAAEHGIRIVTENFKNLTSTAASCLGLLQQLEFKIKMITDFGNFAELHKTAELAVTIPHSVSVHAKADYDEQGMPDAMSFQRCLEVMKQVGYNGAVVLIYDGPGDMWEGLERIKDLVTPYLDK
jgi:sugar phosphate isomerase/epimerase